MQMLPRQRLPHMVHVIVMKIRAVWEHSGINVICCAAKLSLTRALGWSKAPAESREDALQLHHFGDIHHYHPAYVGPHVSINTYRLILDHYNQGHIRGGESVRHMMPLSAGSCSCVSFPHFVQSGDGQTADTHNNTQD